MSVAEKFRSLLETKKFQTIYILLLIVSIPAMIFLNTLVVVGDFQRTITVELQRKALLTTEIVDASQSFDFDNPRAIQTQIEAIADAGVEFHAIDVLIPEGEEFRFVASLDPSAVGQVVIQTPYTLAWQQNQAIAHETNSISRTTTDVTADAQINGDSHFWVVTKSLTDDRGKKLGLLSVKLSSRVVNDLVFGILFKSYVLLMLTLVLVLLVLMAISQIFKSSARLKKQVGSLDILKSKFITVISHVIRTPLNSMRWNLELLLSGDMGELDDTHKDLVRNLYKSNQSLLQTVQTLIVALDIEQNTLKLAPEPTQIIDLVNSSIIEVKSAGTAKKLNLSFDQSGSIPMLKVDKKLMKQAIFALIDNAVKYTEESGTINISLELTKVSVILKVVDDGIGIPDDEKDKVFEKFYRGRTGMTMFTDASGLGLFAANHIVTSHKGKIWFDSKEGEGSTFYMSLPLE
jgi:signal transduction histidine kinase